MEWTTDKPTKPGWYWLKDGSAEVIVQIEVGNMDGFHVEQALFAGVGVPVKLGKMTTFQWAGPLTPPPSRPSEGEG